MSSKRPDLRQLRIRAKELKRGAERGEPAALERILTHHPKFAGRPPERLEGWRVSLRDAQVTIARELGYESWKALLLYSEGEGRRWKAQSSGDIQLRAFAKAKELGHAFCGHDHFLLALLDPPEPTPASDVLAELGLTYEQIRERAASRERRRRTKRGTSSTPAYQLLVGWAQGIAIGLGSRDVTDEHVLLAFAYGDMGGEPLLVWFDVDPDDVVAGLRARGIPTPRLEPPAAAIPPGPHGPRVYFPKEEFAAVTAELIKRYPPGTARWGTNASKWKKGYWYVNGEDEIPMEEIVRSVVKEKSAVEVLSWEEAIELEKATAPRRYRETPSSN